MRFLSLWSYCSIWRFLVLVGTELDGLSFGKDWAPTVETGAGETPALRRTEQRYEEPARRWRYMEARFYSRLGEVTKEV